MYGFFFCFYPLFIPALIWPYPLQTPQERLGVLLLAGGLLALIPVVGFQYHYAAAILPLVYLRLLQSIHRLRNWRPNGKLIGLALAVLLIALIPIQFGRDVWKLFADGEYAPPMAQPYHDVVSQLDALPGRHLVLVRYAPKHDVFQEWVYNRADIDAARIVWAREMSPCRRRAADPIFSRPQRLAAGARSVAPETGSLPDYRPHYRTWPKRPNNQLRKATSGDWNLRRRAGGSHHRRASGPRVRSAGKGKPRRRPLPDRPGAGLHLRRRRPAHHLLAQSGDGGLHGVAAGRQRPPRAPQQQDFLQGPLRKVPV